MSICGLNFFLIFSRLIQGYLTEKGVGVLGAEARCRITAR
jgi:hypothetical protein